MSLGIKQLTLLLLLLSVFLGGWTSRKMVKLSFTFGIHFFGQCAKKEGYLKRSGIHPASILQNYKFILRMTPLP